MANINLPKVVNIEVFFTQPKSHDLKNIEYIKSNENTSLDPITYIVRIELSDIPKISSLGFELYLDQYLVRKYWGYKDGIYFKVYNPRFFEKHSGKKIQLSTDGSTFYDTGQVLPKITMNQTDDASTNALSSLLTQEEVLS